MNSSPEKEKQRSVFDVHVTKKHDPQKHKIKNIIYGRNVINLKPNFRSRHPWIWSIGFVVILIAAFLGIRQIFTKADVQDFYPSSCLGNWQNSANAENYPETLASPDIAFSDTNSAVYTSGTQIFCGGFLPSDVATSGQITNVGLTLVWQIGEPPSPAQDIASSSTATTTIDDSVSSTDVVATSTDASGDTSVTSTSPSSTPDSDDTAPSDTSTPTSDPSSSPDTSFVRQLIPFAFAQDVTSDTDLNTDTAEDATSDASSAIILGPPLTATLGSISSSDATDTDVNSSSSAEPVVVPPPPPDDNFLDVSYSTDGETWISIGQVNMQNWQQFTVTLPISDWNDLQNLQIRIEGIPTTQDPIPPIYLDGMLLEVHYETPTLLAQPDITSSTDETSSSLGATTIGSRMTLVNPGAQQTCEAVPFSQVLPLGGTAEFTLDLHPSINGVSYDLLTGHLPAGISAGFSEPSGPIAATSSITFQAETSTIPGSLNIAVVYQEHENDGSVLSNFCQLNIDVE